MQNNYIKCKTGISTISRNMTRLTVVIDDLTVLTLNETFQYLPDPTFNISTEIPKALQRLVYINIISKNYKRDKKWFLLN